MSYELEYFHPRIKEDSKIVAKIHKDGLREVSRTTYRVWA